MELDAIESTDTAFPEGPTLVGHLGEHYEMALHWHPHYVEDLPRAIDGIALNWSSLPFERNSQKLIPDEAGVYCFAVSIGPSFPQELHIPLYIGKASPGTLRGRFKQYLDGKSATAERKKIANMLNRYQGKLQFWFASAKYGRVHAIENHLLWACFPPCNTQNHIDRRAKLWGKAF